ncbi:MAG: transketolase [Halobacteriovoraceae bacterium]|jgi:transketolase|nr:transketolase [Halobacteriovoraceae bacterium]
MSSFNFQEKCLQIRHDILDIFWGGQRGHIPSAFSLVEILVTLYYQKANLKRDKILLSKGHGCMALYAILSDLGYFPRSEFKKFCSTTGILGGHPTRKKVPGVEISSGSLGHGPSIAVGMAINLKSTKGNVYCVLGDGECNEGSVWEAALSANKNGLNNLTFIIDNNKQQSYGATEEVLPLEPFNDKWSSFGFNTKEVDLIKNPQCLKGALEQDLNIPTAIICHTRKGQGSKVLERNLNWHHLNGISAETFNQIRNSLTLL